MMDDNDDVVDKEPNEEVHNVQIGEVVDRVGFNDAKSALVTLYPFFGNKDLLILHFSSRALKHFKQR